MRTPLNAIVNFLEIALEKSLDQETKDVLTESQHASKSLIYVIDDLLHLTDSSYQMPLPMADFSFSLSESVMTTLGPLQKHASQKALSFNIDQATNLTVRLRGDLQRFQQAIIHLVTNAIRYTEEGSIDVCISARPTTEDTYLVTVTVRDTGVGMPQDALDELFQEFEQVPDEPMRPRESVSVLHGTEEKLLIPKAEVVLGLGLALVARYIRQCGGQIRGKSSQGQGSTFALDVPLRIDKDEFNTQRSGSTSPNGSPHGKVFAHLTSPTSTESTISSQIIASSPSDIDPAASQQERPPLYAGSDRLSNVSSKTVSPSTTVKESPITSQTGKLAVLVADDNPINLSLLKRRLEKMGHDITTSVDGQDCFETFRRQCNTLHFILMDINACRPRHLYTIIC